MSQDTTEQVYAFIRDYMAVHGRSPSQREIARGCFIAKSSVIRYLRRLVAKGKIILIPDTQRNIRLPED